MTELKPLLESGSGGRMRELLEAARHDAPPADFQGRLLVGLGAVATVAGSSTAAAAGTGALVPAAAAPKAASTLAVVKWLLIGVAGGGVLSAGAHAAFAPADSASSPSLAVSVPEASSSGRRFPATLTSSSSVPPPATASVAESTGAPLPTHSRSSSAPAPALASATAPGQLALEVRAIDAARRAFATGQFSRAFAELEEYERIARTGVLDREARVLRIEVLEKAGDRARADSLTQQYLREFPSDEHAARLRALASKRAAP